MLGRLPCRSFAFFTLTVALALFLALFAGPHVARADTFTVDSPFDAVDLVPGDGMCDSEPSLDITMCSLRAAIQEVNALGGGTILIPGYFSYGLTLTGSDEDDAASGDLDINTLVTITAIDGMPAMISAQNDDRVFHVLGSTQLTLNGIRIYDGSSVNGGGIYNAGTLIMNDSYIARSTASHDGGGIYNAGTLTINNSLISGTASRDGGGIYGAGTLAINNSPVSGTASHDGGGIYGAGTLTINNSTVSGTASNDGGGIYNLGSLTMENSSSADSSATNGGGIYNLGALTMENSSIADSSATNGGGLYTLTAPTFITGSVSSNTATADGGGIYIAAQMTLAGVTVADNTAERGGGIYIAHPLSPTIRNVTLQANEATRGGGLYNGAGSPTITASQFLTNTVSTDEGCGGGLYNDSGSPTLEGNTFQGNAANGYINSLTDWAYGRGGGIFNKSGNPIIRNNLLRGNTTSGYHTEPEPYAARGGAGGGMYNESGSPILEDNTFEHNSASGLSYSYINDQGWWTDTYSYGAGGGLFSLSGNITIRRNSFTSNYAIAPASSWSSGGGVYSAGSGSVVIQDNVLEGNSAEAGAAIVAWGGEITDNVVRQNDSPTGAIQVGFLITVENNTVEGNYGPGISCGYTALIRHNTIRNNENYSYPTGRVYSGSGVVIYGGSPTVEANLIEGNEESGVVIQDGDSPAIIGNTIQGNSAGGNGAGITSSRGNAIIADNQIISNTLSGGGSGGGIYVRRDVPIIRHNTIMSNTITCSGTGAVAGGGIYINEGSAVITGNLIISNTITPCSGSDTYIRGGAGLYSATSSPSITDNVIADNAVFGADGDVAGGGLYIYGGKPQILHNSIVGNSLTGAANTEGGGIYLRNERYYDYDTDSYVTSEPVLRNNVIANNAAAGASGGGGVFSKTAADVPNFDYNNVWNNTGGDYSGLTAGEHDLSVDPYFVDAAAGDYHLAANSPCVDAGDPEARTETDFENDPRPMGLGPDMGADEVPGLGVRKSGPAQVAPDEIFTYSVRIVNGDVTSLDGVSMRDPLPAEVALQGLVTDGLDCSHDGAPNGGILQCAPPGGSLAPGARGTVTVTVKAADVPAPVQITNAVTATASSGAQARDYIRTWNTWCQVQLNDGPIGSDLQAALDASTQPADVVRVSGRCQVHDLNLDRTLTLQGGWSYGFGARDAAVHTTILDAEHLGRVLRIDSGTSATVEGFVITGGLADQGGGVYVEDGSVVFQDNLFLKNRGVTGGGLYIAAGDAVVQKNRFFENRTVVGPSGVTYSFNTAVGGGLSIASGQPTIVNNVFYRNTVTGEVAHGGAIYNGSGSPLLLNNALVDNTTQGITDPGEYYSGPPLSAGAGIYNEAGQPVIHNTIIVGNTASGPMEWSCAGDVYSESSLTSADYNDSWNNVGGYCYPYGGPGNSYHGGPHDIYLDPRLANPAAGDFHLQSNSPCIDKGDPNQYADADFDGNFRPLGLGPEIGVDEITGLGMRKTGPARLAPGETFTYALRVANLSGGVAAGVVMTDALPIHVKLTSQQSEGLTCTHDGAVWGGTLRCAPAGGSLAMDATAAVTLTLAASDTLPVAVQMTNIVTATADGGLIARGQAQTWLTWCLARLNDGPVSSDLQATINASTSPSDVVRVSGACAVNNLALDRTLTLQGGWNWTFTARDAALYVTTLDGDDRGTVANLSNDPIVEGFVVTGGLLNVNSGHPTLRHNVIQNSTMGVTVMSGNAVIEDNMFRGLYEDHSSYYPTPSYAIYVNGGAPTIQGNVFQNNAMHYGSVVGIRVGSPTVQNNLFHGNSAYNGVISAGYDTSGVIRYNTLALNYGNAIAIGYQGAPDIRGNIIISTTNGSGIYSSEGAPTLDYNDVWGNTTNYTGVTAGAHDMSANPRLANPVGGDFHLLADSPCIDVADPANYPTDDYEGDVRPQGAAPDIGADETTSAAQPVAPVVFISHIGNDLVLTWQHVSQNTSYQVWQYTAPYFAPVNPPASLLASGLPPAPNCTSDGATITCTVAGAFGSQDNTFYVIRARGASDTWANSNRVGAFGFMLAPGN